MRIQLALDTVDLKGARELIDVTWGLIDIVEIGTPFVIREGLKAVTKICKAYPALPIVADLKIMDGGAYEAGMAFDSGASIVTVLAVAYDITIKGVIETAKTYGCQAMADLIGVHQLANRAAQLDQMGIDWVCVHSATDTLDSVAHPNIESVRSKLHHAGLAVAGGVTPQRLPSILVHQPDIIVVGSYLTKHKYPMQAAREIRDGLNLKCLGDPKIL